mmetsp:Transcript_39026/g.44512  ORF Transcript_39026/g.44512 Transcript_39026/m.44512 type:complete len:522 (+) Transcript_39026:813-2378(+)
MFIQDYGIITTTVALMTLAGIGCLFGILLKNALPKHNSKLALPPEKKKKKRKGSKGKGGRVRQFRGNSSNNTKPIPEDEQVKETSADLLSTHEQLMLRTTTKKQAIEAATILQQNNDCSQFNAVLLHKDKNLGTISSTEPLERPRTLTGDDSFDDTSCDSASLQSFASAPTAVTIGSTGNSESTKTGKHSTQNNWRKQNNFSLRRGGKKLSALQASSDCIPDKSISRCYISSEHSRLPTNESRGFRNLNHHTKQTSPTSGRFANLKEKDTRFNNVNNINCKRSGNGNRNGGKGRIQQGKNNKNSKLRTPALQSASFLLPAISAQKRHQQSISSQKCLITNKHLSSIQATSNHNQCRGSVECGNPYICSPDLRRKKKEELLLLLEKVGISRNEAESIASNVADVQGLEHLSDRELQLYSIPADKRARLSILFAGRRQHSEIRSPPRLSPVHDEPPTLFGSSNRSSSLYLPQLSAKTIKQKPLTHNFAYDEHQHLAQITDEESRIEAELQELGGQMVGSILDF